MKTSKEANTRQVIELDSIVGYHPYEGAVLIRPKSKENATTKAGVIIGFLPDTQYGEGEESHVADLTATEGDVIALPTHHFTPDYEIPNELMVGDHVWFSYRGALLGTEIIVGKEMYLLIDYQYLTAARRWDSVVILNGYILLEDVNEDTPSEVITMEVKQDKTRGIVRFMGQKRVYPQGSKYTDDIDLCEGDMVLLRKGTPFVKMERQPYLSTFSDKPYRRVNRRDIVAVINSFETIEA